jgi:hypothetical protein
MNVHFANVGLFTVDPQGNRIDKNSVNTTIKTMLNTSMASLVIPATDVPNSANYPTLKDYLKAEAASGFKLYHLDQYVVITYDV